MNPCVDYCYMRYGKQYSHDCDSKCEYAKVALENKALKQTLAQATEKHGQWHMEYMAYAKSLREAAEFFQKNCPELPDVVSTYKKSADIIESLLQDTSDYRLVVHMRPNFHDNPQSPFFWCILKYENGMSNSGSGWAATPEQAFLDGSEYLNKIKD